MAGERWKVGSGLRIALRENAAEISKITSEGRIAVMVFDAVGNALEVARFLRWDGVALVFPLDDEGRTRFAAEVEAANPVITEWLARETTTPRLLLLSSGNVLFLNRDENGRWSSEPRTEGV